LNALTRNTMIMARVLMNHKSETKIGLAVVHVRAREMIGVEVRLAKFFFPPSRSN
jgi:hypothetical protein